MYDWNQNGKYDMQDRYIDYKGANSMPSGTGSDWWKYLLLLTAITICPPLSIFILIGVLLFG